MPVHPEHLPKGHNTVNGFIVVDGASPFIDYLKAVFGATEATAVRTPDRDGSLIHAEVRIGNATIMIGDRKGDWPIAHGLTQVYVTDAKGILDKAVAHGGTVVTRVSPFYNGLNIARFVDPWRNMWWLFQPVIGDKPKSDQKGNVSWHKDEPSYVYTSLMDAMRDLAAHDAPRMPSHSTKA